MKTTLFVLATAVASAVAVSGAPVSNGTLSKGTFTEVVNQVSILTAGAQAATPAQTRDVVEAPNSVRTGAKSRAQLAAPDQTITRVGANTVFSFTSASRTFNLEKGTLLFQSTKGKGGGTIISGGASASVLGTTVMVSATENGGFKVVVLEGRAKVILPNGKTIILEAGQIIYVLPGGEGFSGVLNIHLKPLVAGSLLLNGFSSPLPSMGAIGKAIEKQERLIARGFAVRTGQTADHILSAAIVPLIDNNTYQAVVSPPLTPPPPPTFTIPVPPNGMPPNGIPPNGMPPNP